MDLWLLEERLIGIVRDERSRLNSIKEELDMRNYREDPKKWEEKWIRKHWGKEPFSITKEELLNEMWLDVFKALRESKDDQTYLTDDGVEFTPGLDEETKKRIDTLHSQFYDEVVGHYTDPRDAMIFGDLDRMLFKAKKWYDRWKDKRYREYITFLTMHEILYRTSLSGKPSQNELVKRMKGTITMTSNYPEYYADFLGIPVTEKKEVDGWDIGDKQLRLIYKISDDRLLSLMYTFGYTIKQLSPMLPFLENNEESKRLDIMASITCGALHQKMTPDEIVNYIVNSCETDDVYLEGYIERRNRELEKVRGLYE